MQKYYVNTPIYYVNDVPHVGHLYTTLAADVLARYYRIKLGHENVLFVTGTDEHGAKVAQAAAQHNKTPQEYADEVAPVFQKAWEATNISHDYFMRTTHHEHKKIVQGILQKMYDAGHIYKGVYEGLYCVGCEKFLTEQDMVNGKCPLHPNQEPIQQKEDNYFFKLSSFGAQVKAKIESGELEVQPQSRRNEVLGRIEQGIEDISISRQGVAWGIQIPWDTSQTVYVWVEALFNYYTATKIIPGKEDFWPNQLQLMAKDIVWFHACIWPALLLAAELKLPKAIFAHGFFTINGQKMSKSLGNVIAPQELVDTYGADGARYLLLSAYTFGNDGDLALDKFTDTYNSDLANGLGNLVSRTAKLCEGLNMGERTPLEFSEKYKNRMEHYEFKEVLDDIWAKLAELDKYFNHTMPWKLKDSPEALKEALLPVVQGLVDIAAELEPFMPQTAEKMSKQFTSAAIGAVEPYFTRI
ncbi:MAG: Methionine--tRNA ligase [Microgenomates bacterium OLB23]|nr:MAG: Methionine--tRNA ligase [Microgenomates bacterium OLB23]